MIAQLACHIDTTHATPLAALPACDVIYLADAAPEAVERHMRSLNDTQVLLGISLDYPEGMDPRHCAAASTDILLQQALSSRLAAFAAIAQSQGRVLSTVGCHGSLEQDVADDERTTQVVARTLLRFDSSLSMAVPAGRRGIAVAYHCGIQVLREAWLGKEISQPSRDGNRSAMLHIDRYRTQHEPAQRVASAPREASRGRQRRGSGVF
ncbi:LamB/YcsF family protein [Candidimonas nitroreducens]|uniref:Uncharacterized protein n=1 Tax=Candidimonas nitroreducens TaxID=683354 RepID=A0A225MWU2_9BURK|nr:LamB/YcsF family protein [Candidimonas nitroreducens]OWT65695.1 hypothetical protein CEY11_02870 [Candidimonas nitroreducens]